MINNYCASNGYYPDNIVYKIHPADQISTYSSYEESPNISGAE